MALLFQLEDVTRLDESVWKAQISPSEVQRFAPRAETVGGITVILFDKQPMFDAKSRRLAFDPSSVKLLNAGTSETAILVGGASGIQAKASASGSGSAQVGSGDARFLNSLPPQLRALGTKLLRMVRAKYQGELIKKGRYIEAPDNFWTIHPQPVDRSFSITVRGRHDLFAPTSAFEIKPDRGSYSRFKIEREDQLEEFLRVLDQARKKA